MKRSLLKSLAIFLIVIPGYLPAQTFTELELPLAQVDGSSDWGDFDNDGDLDILVTGSGDVIVYRNNSDYTFSQVPDLSLTGVDDGTGKWIDFNNDGILDIFTSGLVYDGSREIPVCYLYTGKPDGTFELTQTDLIGLTNGRMDYADIDNDGFVDLAICGFTQYSPNYHAKIYENHAGTFSESMKYKIDSLINGSLDWGDYDNDHDPDLIMSGWRYDMDSRAGVWETTIYRNDNDSLTKLNAGLKGVIYGSASWGDYDADGDLDILVTGIYGSTNEIGVFRVYRNNGGDSFTEITTFNVPHILYNGSAWGDIDNDGDLDVLATGRDASYNEFTYVVLNNNGNFVTHSLLCELQASSLNMVDFDNDGDLDIFMTGWANFADHTMAFRTDNTIQNLPPEAPSNLHEGQDGNIYTFSWDESTDDHTTASGLTYNVVIKSLTGNNYLVSPYADINSGVRKIASFGNNGLTNYVTVTIDNPAFVWGVQAVDNSFKGSPFAFFQTLMPPVVITDEPTSLNLNEIDLNGRVNPSGQSVFAYFEYGTDTTQLLTTTQALFEGNVFFNFSSHISNLMYNSLYYYRAVAGNVKGEFVVFQTQPDGIDDPGRQFVLYPNPSQGFIKISLPLAGDGLIMIYDMQGKKRMQISASEMLTTNVIDISSLENGIYNAFFFSGNSARNQRIIVCK